MLLERPLCSFLLRKVAKTVGNIGAIKKLDARLEIIITIKAKINAITFISEEVNLKFLSESDFDIFNFLHYNRNNNTYHIRNEYCSFLT